MSLYSSLPYRDALIVPLVVGLTSLYSGFAIFTVLGFMATMKGVAIDKVAAEGGHNLKYKY